MKLIEKLHKHTSKYIVSVVWMYGDGDEYHHKDIECDSPKNVIDYIEAFNNLPYEASYEALEEYVNKLKSEDKDIDIDNFQFNYDYGFVAYLDDYNIMYYDENGLVHQKDIEE